MDRFKTLTYSYPLIWDTITTTSWSTVGKSIGFLVPFFIAAWFGISGETDIFFFAYGLVIFLTGIFSNSIENIIVPFISDIKSKDRNQIGTFVWTILILYLIGLFVLSLLFLFVAKPFLSIVTNFSEQQLNFLFLLVAEILPLLIFVTLTGVLSGIFNSYKIFWLPAISPAFRAIVTICAIYLLKSKIGIHAIPLGYIIGEIFRFLMLVAFILSKKLFVVKFSFSFNQKVIQFLKTASFQSAAMITLGLNPIVDKIMASWLQKGSVTILEYADKLYTIPITFMSGGFIVTILSHWSSHYYEDKNSVNFLRQNIIKMIKFLIPLSLIITIILIVLSSSLVNTIYGYGEFPKEKLKDVRVVWIYYLLGLAPYILCQIFTMGHLVLKKTRALLAIAFIMNVSNIILNLFLMRTMGLPGIALSTSIVQVLAFILLVLSLFKILDTEETNVRI